MSANDKQVAGSHYRNEGSGEQHWDRIYRLYGRGYFVGCATKYIERFHLKNGKQDLEKAIHFLEKLIELEYPDEISKQKYANDYQEQLSLKMAKMQRDAMRGVPDHVREEMMHRSSMKAGLDHCVSNEGAINPPLKIFRYGYEPESQGYVNQDGPDVR